MSDVVENVAFPTVTTQFMKNTWIFENVQSFGGDPTRITISGHGFGAMLASYHLFWPSSWPFFKNIVL